MVMVSVRVRVRVRARVRLRVRVNVRVRVRAKVMVKVNTDIPEFNFTFNGSTIPITNSYKHLGVTFSSDAKCNIQVRLRSTSNITSLTYTSNDVIPVRTWL
jgi:hypothetical protein